MPSLLITGACGYIGRHLIPFLAEQGEFSITAVSSQSQVHSLFTDCASPVKAVCSELSDLSSDLAGDHDVLLNLASAGVAHKNSQDVESLIANIGIACEVARLAKHTRKCQLLHFGSDSEQSNLSVFLGAAQGMSLPVSMSHEENSLYSLSKLVQSTLLRYYSSTTELGVHVIMTPNVYGGLDSPGSLMGGMKAALQSKQKYIIKKPSVIKRFVHVKPFFAYVYALLQDLLLRAEYRENCHGFEVSSVDFVPTTSVEEFARCQWHRLGGEDQDLLVSH